mmetsp:Transcript_24539/g.70813  ORF Transcript_24539/g.70813 Transcript_24539/m.70813 type:complete len:248 (-) Transcript_24539:886-1629(-)
MLAGSHPAAMTALHVLYAISPLLHQCQHSQTRRVPHPPASAHGRVLVGQAVHLLQVRQVDGGGGGGQRVRRYVVAKPAKPAVVVVVEADDLDGRSGLWHMVRWPCCPLLSTLVLPLLLLVADGLVGRCIALDDRHPNATAPAAAVGARPGEVQVRQMDRALPPLVGCRERHPLPQLPHAALGRSVDGQLRVVGGRRVEEGLAEDAAAMGQLPGVIEAEHVGELVRRETKCGRRLVSWLLSRSGDQSI